MNILNNKQLMLFFCGCLLFAAALNLFAAPDPVTNLTAESGWCRITLTWSAPISATTTYYEIRCSTNNAITSETHWDDVSNYSVFPDYPYQIIVMSTPTVLGQTETKTVTGLINGKLYSFAVKSSTDNSEWSNLDTTSIEPQAQPVNNTPVLSAPISPIDGEIINTLYPEFDWSDASPGTPDEDHGDTISSYTLYYSTYLDPEVAMSVENITTTSYHKLETPLSDNTTYYWKFRAYDLDNDFSDFPWPMAEKFVVDGIQSPPVPVTLLAPVNNSTTTATPFFNWTPSSDADPGDTFTYTVRFSTASPSTDFWESTTSLKVSNYTPESDLMEDTTYWWYVEVIDNDGLTSPTTYNFKIIVNDINSPPTEYYLIYPVTGTVVHNSMPAFDWEDGYDPDPYDCIVNYQIEISTVQDFGNKSEGFEYYVTLTGISLSQCTTGPLLEDTTYWWQVTAGDKGGDSWPFLYTSSFVVDGVNVLPSTPTLLLPLNSTSTTNTKPVFDWTDSSDPDPFSSFSYKIYYSSDNFTTSVSSAGLKISSFVPVSDLTDNATYWWNVHAIDNVGGIGESATFWFVIDIDSETPGGFDLLLPTDTAKLTSLEVSFDWEDSIDPDPMDNVIYTLYYSTYSNFIFSVVKQGLTVSSFGPVGLTVALTNYYWRVKAEVSYYPDIVWSSQTWGFYTSNPPPGNFDLIEPADNCIVQTSTPAFTWQESVDPQAETVTYEIEYSSYNFPTTTISSSNIETTSFIPAQNLIENATYWWRVTAHDPWIGTPSNGTSKFFVNELCEPPSSFILISPADGEEVTAVNLNWTDAVDPDPCSSVKYSVFYSTDKNFALKVEVPGIVFSEYTIFATLLVNNTYYWKVKAYDVNDSPVLEVWSTTRTFVTPSGRPRAPENFRAYLTPSATACVLTWDAVTLNEDETICDNLTGYRIYRQESLTEETYLDQVSSGSLSYVDPTIYMGDFYYWVRAVNQLNVESEASEVVYVNPRSSLVQTVFFSDNKEVSISIPTDVYADFTGTNAVNVSITRLTDEEDDEIYRVYEFKITRVSDGAEVKTLEKPAQIVFSYGSISEISGSGQFSKMADTYGLGISYYDGIKWICLGGEADSTDKKIIINSSNLGKYALKGMSRADEFVLFNWPPEAKIITPNNDDKNDVFEIYYDNPQNKIITGKVFDLTGGYVDEMGVNDTEKLIYWDGLNNEGLDVEPGIYIYQIKVEDNVINGTIVVAR